MAQPMTLVATPDPEPTNAGCPEGVAFCSGVCTEYDDGYHSSDFTYLQVKRWQGGEYRKSSLSVSVYREATKRGKLGKAKVTVITGDFASDQLSLTPARTRMLAAHLLNAADLADPIPAGVLTVAASAVRLNDEILTADGWQTVVGQMVFVDQVNVWTDDYDHDPDTNGWSYQPADLVQVRRPMNATDAVMDRKPLPDAVPAPVETSGSKCPSWCLWHCGENFPGPRIHLFENVTVFSPEAGDFSLSLSLDEEQGTPRVWLDSTSYALTEAKSIGEQLVRLAAIGSTR